MRTLHVVDDHRRDIEMLMSIRAFSRGSDTAGSPDSDRIHRHREAESRKKDVFVRPRAFHVAPKLWFEV